MASLQQQEYPDRRFVIFNVTELNQIDFNQVFETSINTVRKSVDETKTFVKWDGTMPPCIYTLETAEGPYTYDEIMQILSTPEWNPPKPEPII